MNREDKKEAKLWQAMNDGRVRCELCSHYCIIPEGKKGICKESHIRRLPHQREEMVTQRVQPGRELRDRCQSH